MDDCSDNLEDGESSIETVNSCSYEETAAKIEQVLRRNLRLDVVDAGDDRQPTQPTVGTCVRRSTTSYVYESSNEIVDYRLVYFRFSFIIRGRWGKTPMHFLFLSYITACKTIIFAQMNYSEIAYSA